MIVAATGKTGTIGRHLSQSIETIQLNLAEDFRVPKFGSSHIVVHMAGVVGDQKVRQDIDASHKVNVIKTVELAKQFIDLGIKRFIYISSSHVYKSTSLPITELSEIEPINKYAEQKLEAELKLRQLFSSSETEFSILRVFSILDQEMPKASLGGALEKIAKGEFLGTMSNGDDVRDFLSQKQIADVVEKIARIEKLPPVINVCSSSGETIRNAAKRMLPFLSEEKIRGIVDEGNSSTPHIVGDNQLLRGLLPNQKLSWNPTPFQRK